MKEHYGAGNDVHNLWINLLIVCGGGREVDGR